jgi:alcohol dehydrogenase
MDHLEEVGRGIPYMGPAVPYVAVPTTAGTGSEATKNAVVSVAGSFKRSFRDDRLVADEAIVDPDLLVGLSPESIAANGLDALSQLLEAYVSIRASPFTDGLASSGLMAARDGLLAWYDAVVSGRREAETSHDRARMAYAALVSGIVLAHAGLGAVHGLAAPLGAFFPIRHGAACGALVAAVTVANIGALEARQTGSPALAKYAAVGRLLSGVPASTPGSEARELLVETLRTWTSSLGIRGLGASGVGEGDIDRLVAASRAGSMRTNPIVLTDDELGEVIRASL